MTAMKSLGSLSVRDGVSSVVTGPRIAVNVSAAMIRRVVMRLREIGSAFLIVAAILGIGCGVVTIVLRVVLK